MIVRFMNGKSGKIFQVTPEDTPMLIYLTAFERKKLLESDPGDAMTLLGPTVEFDDMNDVNTKLRKTDPLVLK